MEKIKLWVKNNKKVVYISLGVLVVIIALILGSLLHNNKKVASNEEELTKLLETIGQNYYEKFYYPQTGNDEKARKEFMKKYKDTGVTSTLANMKLSSLEDVVKNYDEFVNAKTNEKCDYEQTKVRIIPKEPYGEKDYEIEVYLVCGFDKE